MVPDPQDGTTGGGDPGSQGVSGAAGVPEPAEAGARVEAGSHTGAGSHAEAESRDEENAGEPEAAVDPPTDPRVNTLLGSLPAAEYEALFPWLTVTYNGLKDSVHGPNTPITEVYFPLSAVFSMVAMIDGQPSVEVSTIGSEGMVGLPAFLGAHTSPNAAFCQVPGTSARMPVEGLHSALEAGGILRSRLAHLTQLVMVELAQNVACNRAHLAEQRMCRWLLTTGDRVGRDRFTLTQEFLAQMLGVRRPTVSEIAGPLHAAGLIHYARGDMTIRDRARLHRKACECYDVIRDTLGKLYT